MPNKFTEAKVAMLLRAPFFASLMLDMMRVKYGKFPEVFPPGNETAATDGKTIYIDEDFFESLPLAEAVFVLCHEIGHAMWAHLDRAKRFKDSSGPDGSPFNPMVWNVAGDYVINAMLKDANVGRMPSTALYDAKYADWLVDDVYRDLMSNSSKKEQAEQGGNGQGQELLDQHIHAEREDSDVQWKRAVSSAANAAKAVGNLPSSLERFVEELINPQVPWTDKLRKSLTRAAGREATTWTKPHRRRLVTQGVIMPSYTGFNAGELVVAIDTSGSVSQQELQVFLSELDSILTDVRPRRLFVMGADADVGEVAELYDGDSIAAAAPAIKGGGGTRFEPAFKKVQELGLEPATFIYFTDMLASFPDEPPYPVIWCASTDRVAPWGETIQVEVRP